ncbi:hypothetical protein B0H15DRAFT_952427 [Mycena belliarum]|uniref:Uncharacterized protein n=1 Tax=Mycena belliarum TaxID=1033014 RepID=A0AAD6TZ83_9AGAR|nr:hypothetical protein B0H15DRAFT_952427 [Mycena belliae]
MRAADAGLLRICDYPRYCARYGPRAAPVLGANAMNRSRPPPPPKIWAFVAPRRSICPMWLRSAPQRLGHVGSAVSHALGALSAAVGIGLSGDVSEPLDMGGALESGSLAGGPRDWTLIASDAFCHLTSCPFGGVLPPALSFALAPPFRAAALALSHLRLGEPLRARARHERQGTRQRSPTAVLPTRTLVYIPAHRARAESLRSASNGPVGHRRHLAHPPKPFGPTCMTFTRCVPPLITVPSAPPSLGASRIVPKRPDPRTLTHRCTSIRATCIEIIAARYRFYLERGQYAAAS